MRVFVRVTEVISSNRTFKEQVDDVWKGSGYLRISVAHRSPKCGHLRTPVRFPEHSHVVEIPPEWLEHGLFQDLSTCRRCWKDGL